MATKTKSFTVQGTKDNVFGTKDMFAEVKVTVTRNDAANTYKVKVEGMRAYGKYHWDFGQRVKMWLAENASGTGKKTIRYPDDYNYVSIPHEDVRDSYVPSDGTYASSCAVEKVFDGKTDGTCPVVWLDFQNYNPKIKWNDKYNADGSQYYTSFDSKFSGDLSARIKDAVGTNDVAGVTFTKVSATATSPTSISISAEASAACSKIEYRLDGGTWTGLDLSADKLKGTKTVNSLSSISHKVLVRATKSTNGKTVDSKEITVNCSVPVVSSLSAKAGSSLGKVDISFLNHYHSTCSWWYKVDNSSFVYGGEVGPSLKGTKTIDGKANSIATYTVKVQDVNNAAFTSDNNVKCDLVLPKISNLEVKNTSPTTATVSFNTSHICKYKLQYPDGSWYGGTSGWSSNYGTSFSFSITPQTGKYTLYVCRYDVDVLQNNTWILHDATLPVIKKFTMTPIDASTCRVKVIVDRPAKLKLGPDGAALSSYNSYTLAAGDAEGTITYSTPKPNTLSVYKLIAERNDDSNLFSSSITSCDNITPNVSAGRLTAITVNTAHLYAESNYSCLFYLYDSNNNMVYQSLNPSTVLSTSDVKVLSNTNATYKLQAKRYFSGNTEAHLISEVPLSLDTRVPILTFGDIHINHLTAFVTVWADRDCWAWELTAYSPNAPEVVKHSQGINNYAVFELTDLQPGVNYNLRITAVNVANNLMGSKEYGNGTTEPYLRVAGAPRIYDSVGKKFVPSQATVYDTQMHGWCPVVPYVYDAELNEWKLVI